ncbi:DNA-binding domain-containing protein [Sphingobium aromaticiconvertens]|uniref:HvfC/BufC N-terminal domain-containing protein n=1 Tax=Sphingobium aromaticiconvertens TaxID=365341 RepID=UPI0030160AD6
MSLLAMQRDMRNWLTQEDAEGADRLGAAAAPGLRIYQNNYRASLVACLEASFARTQAWIGGEAFLAAAATHIDRVSPSSWTLDAYARDFPDTLAVLYPDDREIVELAKMELALEDVFIGADAAALTVSDMIDVDWDDAILRFGPTLQVIPSGTNAAEIWSALATGEKPPPARSLDHPEAILIWRQDQQPRLRTIDQIEGQALMRMRAGLTFGNLCIETARALGQQEGIERAGQWLGRWISEGLIITIENSVPNR